MHQISAQTDIEKHRITAQLQAQAQAQAVELQKYQIDKNAEITMDLSKG